MIFHSIKWRLQLWYGLILVAVLVGFGVTAFHLERGRIFRRLEGELHRRVTGLAEAVRPPRGPGRIGDRPFDGRPQRDQPALERAPQLPREFHLPTQVAALFDEADPNGYYYEFFWRPGSRIIRSANAPQRDALPGGERNARIDTRPAELRGPENLAAGEPTDRDAFPPNGPDNPPGPPPDDQRPPNSNERRPQLAGTQPEPPQRRGDFLEVVLMTPRGDRIIVGRNIRPELSELRLTAVMLAAVGGGILLLGLAGGWWLAGRAIRPIADISATAAKIAGGDMSQRIPAGDTETELGQLATTLNSTFARLEASFAQQAQFTNDAAHELRTPVTVILTQTQSTLNKERSAAEYKETLEACQRAAQRMRRLTESLLQLARMDAGQETFRREPFDLAVTAQNCVELLRPLAAAKQVAIHTELSAANSSGDADRISQVVTNLLTNAIKYTQDGGEIRVSVGREGGLAVLKVTDNGPGISREDLPRVFERFYRVDKARSSSEGNAGLGLSICKAIVEAHGGTMDAASEPGRGATFTVRLPA